MRRDLPTGTVTFLFTDVEGSTKLLQEHGDAYADLLAEHRRRLREAFTRHGGVEVDMQGDSFFFAFPTAPGALAAAGEATEALGTGPVRVRIGLHTGTPLVTEEGYVGGDVHRASRIAAAGHGGQVLVSASTAPLVELELTDLGEHRFKDLDAPERVFQLGAGNFPPLKSLFRTNLPVPLTPFLGRAKELAELVSLVSREDVRLLTLTGPGGTGKTRLAMQAAGALAERYTHGVFWVPLAPLRDPSLVLATAEQVVGAKNGLAEHIQDKELLLLFDNFEQVVEAAADVGGLLASCPSLDLLVTSREALHVTGEQEYQVPPLVHDEGVGFFVARARAVKPDFQPDEAVSEICRRLDDLPLALELAAARVKALSSVQMLDRLEQRLPLLSGGARDAPVRQRTLRATIAWSDELLEPEEQRLFARLAVFVGGCTLEAAEEVTEADLDTLQSLVDKSLLRHTEERFSMLETIREYALERLEDSSEAEELRRRHAEHVLALAEEAEPSLLGMSPGDWLDRLERELDNLRAALDWLLASADGERAQRLAGAVHEFFCGREHVPEGRRYLESALRIDDRHTPARAKALNGAAHMARDSGDAAAARLRAEEGLALHQNLGDAHGSAHSLLWLGSAVADEGDFARARQLFEESARLFGEAGDDNHALMASRMLAWTYYELGDRERAHALHEDNLGRAQARGSGGATTLSALASCAVEEGRIEDAVSLASESLRIYRDLGSRSGVAEALCRCAAALALKGRAATAVQLLSSAEALHEERGTSMIPSLVAENEGTLAAVRAQLDEAEFVEAWEQGRALTVEDAAELVLHSVD